ncbi:MAG: uncharacterized membrane protein (UPF0127 family) [Paraglaciecola sp.]|jgi:uncharacterized membrane protein (UPF0127 family)
MRRLIILILCFQFAFVVSAEPQEFGQISLKIKTIEVNVEYADTYELRAQGLMFRKFLCPDCGMFFRFGNPRLAGIWMKNTFVPLDVAFIRKDGVITDIKALVPHDLTSINSSKIVLYALEMNQGWFKKNGISVGDTVQISPSL